MAAMEVSRYLEQVMVKTGNSKSGLARTAGISRYTLYRILSGELEEIKITNIIRLAGALNIDAQAIMTIYFQ